MAKTYCKYAPRSPLPPPNPRLTSFPPRWPVIIAIIVGSVITLSVIWCLARCLCCGLSCCCDCLSCCNPRRNKSSRYADQQPSIFHPAPYQGYQQAPNPPSYEPPRFAQFDVSRNGKPANEDALPPMPSWDSASQRRVPDGHDGDEDVEMGPLAPVRGPNDAPNEAALEPRMGYAEADSYPVDTHAYGRQETPNVYGGQTYATRMPAPSMSPAGYGASMQQQQQLGGPQSYSTYAPSESTRYEPSGYEQPFAYHARSPPPVGRKPVQDSWRDV